MSEGWTTPGPHAPGPPPAGPPPHPGPPPPPGLPAAPGLPPAAPYGGPPGQAAFPYGQAYGQPWSPPPARGFRAPAGEPRPYPQLLRSPTYRWWRPLVSLGVGVAVTGVIVIGLGIAIAFVDAATGEDVTTPLSEGPVGFLFTNLIIAAAIPVSMAAVTLGFLRPPTFLLSVVLRMRWRWMAVCSAWLVGWALVATGLWFALDGLPSTGGEQAVLLIALCLLTTPLQAAGEEFLVRGWLTQSIGAWFARPVAGAVVAGLVSATVFALLHGTQNAWLFGDRFAFGVIASYLVWRTGGLEAAIALHAISNISAIIPSALEGTLDESLTVTEAPVGTVLVDVVMLLVAAVIVVVLARRRDVERLGPHPEGPGHAPEPVHAR